MSVCWSLIVCCSFKPLTKEELSLLDDFDKLANTQLSKTYENDVNNVVNHYLNVIESKSKPVLGTTYVEVKKIFDKILTSTYWSCDRDEQTNLQSEQTKQSSTGTFCVVFSSVFKLLS
jgi:hypothetical protein